MVMDEDGWNTQETPTEAIHSIYYNGHLTDAEGNRYIATMGGDSNTAILTLTCAEKRIRYECHELPFFRGKEKPSVKESITEYLPPPEEHTYELEMEKQLKRLLKDQNTI
jgi:hypothetical protein